MCQAVSNDKKLLTGYIDIQLVSTTKNVIRGHVYSISIEVVKGA